MKDTSQLKVGAACSDITPPLEAGLLTSSVNGTYALFDSVRLPLKARVIALSCGEENIAIVSLDLLALNDTSTGGWENFKKSLSAALHPEKIIITCTHTHTAPESVALSNLYLKPVYIAWLNNVQQKIKEAISVASNNMQPCSVLIGYGDLQGFNMQRRVHIDDKIVMSDALQPVTKELMDKQPVDRRVKVLRFIDDNNNPVATIVEAVCHPVHEMCLRHISPDFPGELCLELEKTSAYGLSLFLNGAAGDTNPPTVSMGAVFARQHGVALANVVKEIKYTALENAPAFKAVNSCVTLSIRLEAGINNLREAIARFSAVRFGNIAVLFLPGEPFIETANYIEQNSPFDHTIIAAYGENSIGYIPTNKAFDLGGYETGPGKWSYLEKGTDKIICDEGLRLLQELNT